MANKKDPLQKVYPELYKNKKAIDIKSIVDKGSDAVSESISSLKRKTRAVKKDISSRAETIKEKGKSAQMQALSYFDKKKTEKYLEAKLIAFEDGIKQGKQETVDALKVHVDYYLAVTALSYYFARCDGSIDESEQKEIDRDMEGIIKNKDLPDSVIAAINAIAEYTGISFEYTKTYLDKVSNNTLKELVSDVHEIINADGEINKYEYTAKKKFDDYCNERLGACNENDE